MNASRMPLLATISMLLLIAMPAEAQKVARHATETRLSENIPPIPPELLQRLNEYQNARSAASAGWLADGSGQFLLTRFGSTNQVHWIDRAGGARRQLTFYDEPIASVHANPERNGFVFGRDVGGSEFWQLYWFDFDRRETTLLTDGTSRNEAPVWNNAGTQVAFSTTMRNGRDSDIHVVGLDGKPSKPVLEEGGTWFAVDFSPDDRRLIVTQYVSINETRPHVLDLSSGELTPLYDPEAPGSYFQFAFTADGGHVVYVADEDDEFRRLRLRELGSDESTVLTPDIDWDVESFAMSPDRSRLTLTYNEHGFSKARELILTGDGARAAQRQVTLPRGVSEAVAYSPDGESIAFTVSPTDGPGDAFVAGADRALTQWTFSELGGLDPADIVAPELVQYPTFDTVDGKPRTIPAYYFKPRRGAGPFPVVIYIHGGPEAQARPYMNPDQQFLLNELGVAVLVPNVRGSNGYGKSYLQLDNGIKREDSVRDIGALLDWVAARPELDQDRVGVFGGSYGGYMVLASMAHYGDRLRAGIDIVGISNFVTFLENTQDYRRDLRRAEYGDEREPDMRAFLTRISPTTNAAKIDIPLFVAQGANDPRVPASESEQIVRTVRGNEGDVWYLLFKDEGHGFRKKPNRDYFGAAAMLFWQTHLLPEGGGTGDSVGID